MRPIKLIALLLVLSVTFIGCNLDLKGSGSTRGASGDVTLSGLVETVASASVSSPLQGLGVVNTGKTKFVVSSGTVTIMNSVGQTLDVVAVHSDGTYTTSLPAADVQGETLFVVYDNELDKTEPEIHSYDAIPSTATSATIDVNTETDFSTAVFLAVAEQETGKSYEVGGDLTGALEVVAPDAIKDSVEAVVGDTSITTNTSLDTADVGMEAAYQAHQGYIAGGGSPSATGGEPTPPVDVLKEAIGGDTAAIALIGAITPTVGGGIPIDATVYTTALDVTNTIYETYANKADAAVAADWETIKASAGAGGLLAYIGPIVGFKPSDFTAGLVKPTDLRYCTRNIASMEASVAKAFENSKAQEAMTEQIRIGACDDPDEAKFVMGALGGAMPVSVVAANGTTTYDFANFIPATVAQAAQTVGLDCKNKIDPAQYATYTVGDLAKSFAPQMGNAEVIQTCALTGIAGCSGLVSGIINNAPGTVLDSSYLTIPKPPGSVCTAGNCAAGGTCTAQTDGSLRCAALSGKLGLSCTTSPDCDGVTYCGPGLTCLLSAGATTGMGSITAAGVVTSFGGTEVGAPVVTSTGSAGGICSDGSCAAGSTCQSGICVASTTVLYSGTNSSCLTSATCSTGLTCSGGICQGPESGGGGLKGLTDPCISNSQCGSNCCSAAICSTSAICTTTTTTTGGTTTTTTGGTTTTTTGGTTTTTTNTACTTACAAGSSCTSDATCASGYCGNRSFSTSPGTCADPASGAAGQYCLVSTNCSTGLTCNSSNACTAQSSCTGPELMCTTDASCCSGYCGGFSNSRVCKPDGSGLIGHVCHLPSNCQVGYPCNTGTMTCSGP